MAINDALARFHNLIVSLRLPWAMALALAVGGIATLAQAPFGLWPLLFLIYPVLIVLVDGTGSRVRSMRAAFFVGWAFGFGSFLSGLYWIGNSFLVNAEEHAWLLPFAMTLLPALLALFPAAGFLLARRFWCNGNRRILVFAASVVLVEYVRGHVLTGLPWNLPGQVFSENLALLQSASLVGVYGLSLIALVVGGAAVSLFDVGATRRLRFTAPALGIALIAVMYLFGAVRLSLADSAIVPDMRVRIVQPNVPQAEKYVAALRARNWQILLRLSGDAARDGITHVIWPEAAPPFLLERSADALLQIDETLGHVVLLTGAARVEGDLNDSSNFYNSFYVIRDGAIIATYDKAHLVPFGEYLPLSDLLETLGISKLIGGPGNFTAGTGIRTLSVVDTPPFGPLICYEIIFPSAVIDRKTRPSWLVNVTDDSWFGNSIGPQQHLAQARIRAVEEGLPVARAANTGVSAMINPYGRILASLPYDSEGAINIAVPMPLNPTAFSVLGDLAFTFLFIITAAFGLGVTWLRLTEWKGSETTN